MDRFTDNEERCYMRVHVLMQDPAPIYGRPLPVPR